MQLVTTGTLFDSDAGFTIVAKPQAAKPQVAKPKVVKTDVVKPEVVNPEIESRSEIPLAGTVSDASRYGAELVSTISEIALKISTSLDTDTAKVPVSQSELKSTASSSSGRQSPFLGDKDKPSTSPKTFLASIEELPRREQKHERDRIAKELKKEKERKEEELKFKSVGTETTPPGPSTSSPLSDSITSLMNCSKCVTEGKTCVGECPSAKRKRENNNQK